MSYGFSLERATTQKKLDMPSVHSHQEYELYFLISGQRRYFLGHTIYDIAPGNMVYIPRTLLHKTVSVGGKGFDRYVINFSQEHYNALTAIAGYDFLSAYPEGVCLQLPHDKVLQIQKSFEQMDQELKSPSKWTQCSCTMLLYGILFGCVHHGKAIPPYQEETADKIQQAAKYISEHFADMLTLEDIAEMVHIEKTYFCKRFKALTGFGYSDYLTQTRLQAAKALLVSTDLTIGEISEACGFSGSNYFGDVFRHYYGVSPSKYRQQSGKSAK